MPAPLPSWGKNRKGEVEERKREREHAQFLQLWFPLSACSICSKSQSQQHFIGCSKRAWSKFGSKLCLGWLLENQEIYVGLSHRPTWSNCSLWINDTVLPCSKFCWGRALFFGTSSIWNSTPQEPRTFYSSPNSAGTSRFWLTPAYVQESLCPRNLVSLRRPDTSNYVFYVFNISFKQACSISLRSQGDLTEQTSLPNMCLLKALRRHPLRFGLQGALWSTKARNYYYAMLPIIILSVIFLVLALLNLTMSWTLTSTIA